MDEFWDVYDKFKRKTGKVIKKNGEIKLKQGEFHLVATGIIQNSDGLILLSKRKENKSLYPGLWECSGGSAKFGETSQVAVIREIYEELGIKLSENSGKFIGTVMQNDYFRDIWLFKRDVLNDEIKFIDGEVSNTRWVSIEEYEEMYKNGIVVPTCSPIIKKLRELEMEEER